MDDFDQFWQAYPNKKSKGAARRKFAIAIKKVSLAKMLVAIDLYKANKPSWCSFRHPATWLHNEGWDDVWETPEPQNAIDVIRNRINGQQSADSHRPAIEQLSLEEWTRH